MVTRRKIYKAINAKIKAQFPNVKTQKTDTEKGILRPSFRIGMEGNVSNFMGASKDTNLTVRLYYFPTNKDKYRNEMMDTKDTLEQCFLMDNTITLESGFTVQLWDLEFDIVDGVLHCYFELNFSEGFEIEDEIENMEDIDIDI